MKFVIGELLDYEMVFRPRLASQKSLNKLLVHINEVEVERRDVAPHAEQ